MDVKNFFLGSSLGWMLSISLSVIFTLSVLLYALRKHHRIPFGRIIRWLAVAAVFVRVLYASFTTYGQYYIWSQGELGQLLLNSPLASEVPLPKWLLSSPIFAGRFGYFTFYALGHFWASQFVAIGVSILFWWFLKILQKYRAQFFEAGEVTLGLLTSLIIGWPNVLVFIPLTFVLMVLLSLFRTLVLKQYTTTIGWPLLIAAALTMVWGNKLVSVLGWGVLRV